MVELKNILFIEDESIIAKDVKGTLEKSMPCTVDLAHSYSDALAIFNESSYDLLLADINLNEDKDGIDLVKELMTIRKTPVVFLTAYKNAEVVEKAKKITPFAYLIKPFNEVQLKVTIELAILNFKKELHHIEEVEQYERQIELLTKREKEVLVTLASGNTAKEAAYKLHISEHTVLTHKKNIKSKLEMNTMTELINFALATRLYTLS